MDVKRPAIAICIVFVAVALFMLAGCVKDPPPTQFVTVSQPELPAECFAPSPAVPRLPDADVDTAAAARDRQKLVEAVRLEGATRRACAERLRALYPPEKKS
jgi:uncharacterized lipoprotein YajG